MASTPVFTSTINIGSALLTAGAETDLQTPTKTTTVLTAGASGTRVDEIVVHMTSAGAGGLAATSSAGLVYVFLYDGSTYHLYDAITVDDLTATATAAPFRKTKTYANLLLKTGWSVRCSQSIAANQSATRALKVSIFGEDL